MLVGNLHDVADVPVNWAGPFGEAVHNPKACSYVEIPFRLFGYCVGSISILFHPLRSQLDRRPTSFMRSGSINYRW